MKIAFLGSRGIPRCYSGFETFVEEVACRLAMRSHDVTVYNRTPFNKYTGSTFKGVKIKRIPTIQAKGTDTLVHSALCTAHTLLSRFDIVYYCGVGSSIFSLPAKIRGAKTVVNVDGADWERAKWGLIGKTWLRWSERMAAVLADSVIADHPIIKDRYKRQFGIDCELISYGADVVTEDPGDTVLHKFGLTRNSYFIYISRLTPENGADLVMEAYLESKSDLPLVVVGDAPYLPAFREKLKDLEKKGKGKILMTGYQFGEAYRQLSFHSRAFIFPTTIEATRPVLLEQMGMGSCIIARDTPANQHILGDAAVWFDVHEPTASLAKSIRSITESGFDKGHIATQAQERIRKNYNWEIITSQYEELFQKLKSR
jgi:glycosyltransferase involved in cell wall biosynthesis